MSALVGLYLFGSTARGDLDSSSDVDVLAVYDSKPCEELRRYVRARLFAELGNRLTLAEYSSTRLSEMFDQGHLFAWHLYLESKSLQIEGIKCEHSQHFLRPSPYKSGIADAQRFAVLLASVASEIGEDTCSPIHEAGLAYLGLRNIAMSSSVAVGGRPDFTRESPFNISETLGIAPPCSRSTYKALISARHASQRGLPAPVILPTDLRKSIDRALKWSDLVMEKVSE